MIKIESDNNIAVVSMDEYNKGLKAIKALNDLAMMPNEGFEFVYVDHYQERYFDHFDKCWKGEDAVILREDQVTAIKNQLQLEFDIRNESKTLELQKKEHAFEDKLTKARKIKWYHLLFGWRALGF